MDKDSGLQPESTPVYDEEIPDPSFTVIDDRDEPKQVDMSFKHYIGTKGLYARPMDRGSYNEYRGWDLPSDENPMDEGYLIECVNEENPNHPNHKGYISWSPKDVFERFYAEVDATEKSLANTDANGTTKNVPDVTFWGDGDLFKLISKASSKSQGWMKSTKAMEVGGLGVVVQVTTQQGDNVAEALTFVPRAGVREEFDDKGNVISRSIVSR